MFYTTVFTCLQQQTHNASVRPNTAVLSRFTQRKPIMVLDEEKDPQETPDNEENNAPESGKEEMSATMQFLQQMEEEKKEDTTTQKDSEKPEAQQEEAAPTPTETPEPVAETTEEKPADPAQESEGDYDSSQSEEDEEDELEDLQEEDFSNWTLEQLTEKSEELVAHVKAGGKINFKRVDRTLRDLKDQVDELNSAAKDEALTKFTADGSDPANFKYTAPPLVEKFFDNYRLLRKSRREYFENLEAQKAQNLLEKKKIVEKIKDLTDSIQDPEADNRKDFAKMKELQEQWKKIGSVPQPEADDLYKTYRAVVDMFYNQKSLERELLDLDREKNQKLKEELCQKAEALLEAKNIHEAVKELNLLHKEYKEIGPVPREVQEDLWQRFKAASDKIYDKKREEVEAFKKQLEGNMKAKQELCIEVEQFVEFDSDRIKEWNKKTRDIKALQKKWEDIGPAPREVAKSINKQFWSNFKQFFANKSKFFEKLEAEREENLKKKIAFCERAEELKDSFEWDEVANELKKLQREWKDVGPVPKSKRESVYQRFKAACDHFFERKRNRRAEQEKEFAYNLEKKQKLCAEIEGMVEAGNKDLEHFEEICVKFEKAGFVPRNSMNSIQERFMKANDAFFAQLDMADEEREQFKLQMQFRALGDSPKAIAKFRKQEGGIIRKIDRIRKDVQLWERNLEFFAKSKTADKLRKEFEDKIGSAEQEIEELEQKLKLIKKIKNGEVDLKKKKQDQTPEAEEKATEETQQDPAGQSEDKSAE